TVLPTYHQKVALLKGSCSQVVGNPSVTRPNGQQRVRCGLFECKSVSRARGVANTELSDEADSEKDLGGSYVLHRTGHSQEDDQLLREGRERSDPSGRQDRIDALRTGQLDQDTSPTPHDRYGSDDLHRVDLRSPASACGKGQGGQSSDVAGDRSSKEEERPDRFQQDRRLSALRFPAGVLYGFHRDEEPASDPSLPKPCPQADDPDEEPYCWPADGDWRELQQTAAAQVGLLHGADVVQ